MIIVQEKEVSLLSKIRELYARAFRPPSLGVNSEGMHFRNTLLNIFNIGTYLFFSDKRDLFS